MTYDIINGSTLGDLLEYNNSITSGFFMPLLVLAIISVITINMIRKNNSIEDSVLAGGIMGLLANLIFTALGLMSAMWLIFYVAVILLVVLYKYSG